MNSFLSTHDFEMNFSHLDDKMEVGTSPYPPMDDIDFDFEPDRQPSVDRSMADDAEALANSTDAMHAEPDNIYNDDDMLDDEITDQILDNNAADFSMEQDDEETIIQQDDEILYDDEEEDVEETASVDMTEQHDAAITQNPASYEENNEETLTAEEGLEQQDDATNNHTGANVTTESDETPEQQSILENAKAEESEEVAEQKHSTGTVDTVDFAEGPSTSESLVADAESLVANNLEPKSSKEEAEHVTERDHALTPSQQPTEAHAVQEEDSQLNESDMPEQVEAPVNKSASEHLHPITVLYLGQEMSFFPPMMGDSSATFFLSDSKLAYEPVEKLLASCRDILGDTLEHDDELVLDVPALGLHICEDSKYASQITLSQISEVYVNLSRNEHMDEIEPLYCSLSSRVCLSSQYAYLAASAAEGKTYSEIAADYIDSPDHDANSVEEGTQVDESDETEHPDGHSNQDGSNADLTDVQQTQDAPTELDQLPQDSQNSSAEVGPELSHIDTSNDPSAEPDKPEHAQDDTEENDPSKAEDQPSTEDVTTQPSEDLPKDDIENDEIEQSGIDGETITNDETNEPAEQDDDASGSSHTVEAEDFAGWLEKPQDDLEESDLSYLEAEGNDEESLTGPDKHDMDENALGHIESTENAESGQDMSNIPGSDGAVTDTKTHKDDDLTQTEPNDAAEETLTFDEEEDLDAAIIEGQTSNGDEADLLQVEDLFAATAPTTPSKPNGSKRKALNDEEDLDFLDFSTPEPKRTRAS